MTMLPLGEARNLKEKVCHAINTYFIQGTSLKEHIPGAVEQEHTECAMQPDIAIRIHSMAIPLRGLPNGLILIVDQDAGFL